MFCAGLQLKESAGRSTDLQHQLEKAKQQHQELQALQQNTNGKLRESQVLSQKKPIQIRECEAGPAECHMDGY